MCFLLVVVWDPCWKCLSEARCTLPLLTGLWYYLQGKDRPCLTLIGSPNFGYRSVHRDLEAQIAIVTENKALQSQLQEVGQPQEMMMMMMNDCVTLHWTHTCYFMCWTVCYTVCYAVCYTVCLSGAGEVVSALHRGVELHVRAAGPSRQVVGEISHSPHQELLLRRHQVISHTCTHSLHTAFTYDTSTIKDLLQVWLVIPVC